MMKFLLRSALCAAFTVSISTYEVKPITPEQAAEYKLDPAFSKKGTVTRDILIATSERVADVAHQEAS